MGLGGGSYDGGAAGAAVIQAQTARENAQAEEVRWEREQQLAADQRSQATADTARQTAAQKADLDAATQKKAAADAAAAAAANSTAPPTYQWNNTRTDNAKALASTGLPFGQLTQQTQSQYSAANPGYLGQSNAISSNSGVSFGGRKYV